jgi:hypothetical protein
MVLLATWTVAAATRMARTAAADPPLPFKLTYPRADLGLSRVIGDRLTRLSPRSTSWVHPKPGGVDQAVEYPWDPIQFARLTVLIQ